MESKTYHLKHPVVLAVYHERWSDADTASQRGGLRELPTILSGDMTAITNIVAIVEQLLTMYMPQENYKLVALTKCGHWKDLHELNFLEKVIY